MLPISPFHYSSEDPENPLLKAFLHYLKFLKLWVIFIAEQLKQWTSNQVHSLSVWLFAKIHICNQNVSKLGQKLCDICTSGYILVDDWNFFCWCELFIYQLSILACGKFFHFCCVGKQLPYPFANREMNAFKNWKVNILLCLKR